MQAKKKQWHRLDLSQPEDLDKIDRRAMTILKTHMDGPMKAIQDDGYNRLEIAAAYLLLAYHALRYNRPKEQAESNFKTLSHYAKLRIEHNDKKRKLRKLH